MYAPVFFWYVHTEVYHDVHTKLYTFEGFHYQENIILHKEGYLEQ